MNIKTLFSERGISREYIQDMDKLDGVIITNDDDLFKKFNFLRLGQVDSEIIFRLFNEVHPSENLYSEKITQQAKLLEGTFATISIA